jgi:AraC-like DNA-binding protein
MSPEEKLKYIHREEELNIQLVIAGLINITAFAGYIIASLIEIRKHKKRIRLEFSYEQNIDLKWLRNLVTSLIIIAIIILGVFMFLFFKKIHVFEADYSFYMLFVLFVFGLGYWGFKQGTIFNYKIIQTTTGTIHEKKNERSFSDEENLAKELHNYMIQNKPYLDPKLSLYGLSSSMDWSSQELSTLLNKSLKTNFYEYVNNYRVEEAKKRLKKDNQKFTVLAIAYDCGFNSKASFNRIFKQNTGSTPSDFVKANVA